MAPTEPTDRVTVYKVVWETDGRLESSHAPGRFCQTYVSAEGTILTVPEAICFASVENALEFHRSSSFSEHYAQIWEAEAAEVHRLRWLYPAIILHGADADLAVLIVEQLDI